MKYLILLSVAMTLSFVRCGQGHHQGTTVGDGRKHGLRTCSVDSTDANEERAFGVPTAPPLREMMRGQAPEMKLSLPQIASDSPVLPASLPASSQLIILVPGGDDVYAYTGGTLQNAQKYSYQQLLFEATWQLGLQVNLFISLNTKETGLARHLDIPL